MRVKQAVSLVGVQCTHHLRSGLSQQAAAQVHRKKTEYFTQVPLVASPGQPALRNALSNVSTSSPCTACPLPSAVSAASKALMMASSTASVAARNSSLMWSLLTMLRLSVVGAFLLS